MNHTTVEDDHKKKREIPFYKDFFYNYYKFPFILGIGFKSSTLILSKKVFLFMYC